jgi:hypothetical protein
MGRETQLMRILAMIYAIKVNGVLPAIPDWTS